MKLILPIDIPNKNGRVYPREIFKKALIGLISQTDQILTEDTLSTLLLENTGPIKYQFSEIENGIEIDIIPLNPIQEKIIDKLNANDWEIIPRGMGEIVDGVMQNSYVLFGLDIVPKNKEKK